jgi:endonuclease YncB( thermonuclease family)
MYNVRLIIAVILICPSMVKAADFEGFPFVQDDGTLRIHHATVRLYGILIPPTDESCRFFVRPVECAPRAVLALKFNIGSGYVKCTAKGSDADGTQIALCTVDDKDLSAMLLRQGWAAALPDAPFEYTSWRKSPAPKGWVSGA